MHLKFFKNPYLIFLPFLLLFILLVLLFHTDAFEGDEGRYLMFAQNLLHGFYSPPAPYVNLWNGPGYPLVLAPFVGLHLPLICLTLLNAVFYYLSIVFLFKALHLLMSFRNAWIFSLFWACYFNAYQKIARINSETLTILLISLLVYTLLKAFGSRSNKYLFLSGLLIGCIALTKIIFGYVLMFMLFFSVLLWIILKNKKDYKKGIVLLLIASAITAPYLIYTYQLTGRIFYWGNSGGLSLYWMSTPYPGEFGDYRYGKLPEWHQKDLEPLAGLNSIERDDALKRIALGNIKAHPTKYVKNWIANLGRLFFNFPYTPASDSYANVGNPLRSLAMLPLNAIVFILMIYSLFMTLCNWKGTDYFIRFLLYFVFLYLGASSVVSAYSRQFYIIVPALLFWIAYITDRSLTIKIKFKK
jgi:4-amino-4-deoxy-L-arabinose transferase-like glycosyltransferase